MLELLDFGLDDVADILVVGGLLWGGIGWLRQTRARLAVPALLGTAVIYLAASRLGLELAAGLLRGFFAVFAIVLVVIFQDDLRRLFERVSAWGLGRKSTVVPSPVSDVIGRCVAAMAAARTGALLVFPGNEPLERHIEGGVELQGRVSEPLLLSLFDASSPGHDGAVVVEGNLVARFAAHLPLSSDRRQLGHGGTRHAAALGLAEATDALCVVVSEERGSVSVARDGRLRTLPEPAMVAAELAGFNAQIHPPEQPVARWRALGRTWKEGLLAFGTAGVLWILLVPGSSVIEARLPVQVVVENLPAGYEVESVEPTAVEAAVRGRRRDIVLANPDQLRVRVDGFLVKLGRRTFELSPQRVEAPAGIEVLEFEPAKVVLRARETPPEPE